MYCFSLHIGMFFVEDCFPPHKWGGGGGKWRSEWFSQSKLNFLKLWLMLTLTTTTYYPVCNENNISSQ